MGLPRSDLPSAGEGGGGGSPFACADLQVGLSLLNLMLTCMGDADAQCRMTASGPSATMLHEALLLESAALNPFCILPPSHAAFLPAMLMSLAALHLRMA